MYACVRVLIHGCVCIQYGSVFQPGVLRKLPRNYIILVLKFILPGQIELKLHEQICENNQ